MPVIYVHSFNFDSLMSWEYAPESNKDAIINQLALESRCMPNFCLNIHLYCPQLQHGHKPGKTATESSRK